MPALEVLALEAEGVGVGVGVCVGVATPEVLLLLPVLTPARPLERNMVTAGLTLLRCSRTILLVINTLFTTASKQGQRISIDESCVSDTSKLRSSSITSVVSIW